MGSFARAAALGVASTLLVIAALCVLDASMSTRVEDVAESTPVQEDDLRGNSLLKAQAKALNDQRHFENRGKDMRSVDEMLEGFQSPSADDYSSLTEALEKQAPKKDDLDVALSSAMPDAQGVIHFGNDKPKDPLAAELEFVQVQDWTPSGQQGLSEAIRDAKDSEEEEALKEDKLHGHGVLSAVGLATEEEEQDALEGMMLVQTDGNWEPEGQEGFEKAISSARADDEAAEAKQDGLHGDNLLSAVGIASDADDDAGFSSEELGLVQVEASEWVPQGQTGLSSTIHDREADDEAAQVKADGLKGTTLLGAVGMAEETSFVQDPVAEWKPKGQHYEVKETFDDSESTFEMEKKLHDDGLEGEGVLSAVGMAEQMKPADEMTDLGTIKADELDLDLD